MSSSRNHEVDRRPDGAPSGAPAPSLDPDEAVSTEASPAQPLVLWELVQTAHLAGRAFRRTFGEFGLTPVQFGVLSHLADGHDLTKAQLARSVLVTPQSMDPLIETLLTRELVARDGPARRGRAAAITITDAGRTLLAAVRPSVDALNSPERLGLHPTDITAVLQILLTVREHL